MRSFVLAAVLAAAALTAATGTAAAAGLASPLSSEAATGGVGVRLLDAPSDARDDPRARQYIVDHLAPGSVIHRRIEVSNTTPAAVRVSMYPAAASIENGSFIGAAGHTPNDLSSWTTLDQDVLDIAPGTQTTVTITVTVPADAPPGEQYGAVWAETSAPNTSGVNLVNRVGIRLYLSVGAGNAPPSSFTVDSLTAARAPDGHPVVTAQVHNTGGRALDMSGNLSLSDGPGSLNAGPFPAQLVSTLAPGQSTMVSISLDQQLPDGPWNANISLTSGLLEESYQARIQFPPNPGATAPVPAQKSVDNYLGIILIGVLLAALVTVAVLVVVRHRSRQKANRQLV
ncbi:MAG: hypothetical protein JWP64_1207 [Pseudonocardia sp.]|jgi:hypothetical protein|uniref:hypothetical protein n=1 Tax=Pseudonocardia sp. TaxID=60912 RepID=UPI00261E8096|nr:hypothetical protein [Pseudonocardia sp.]MCU1626258.1 hypothetical protein [Pseudonocardia sp.]MDT7698013.1 hypothetical protein [Pseudonocardiales bacterium]